MSKKTRQEPTLEIETKTYADGTTATGVAPLPDHSPAEQDSLSDLLDAPAEQTGPKAPLAEAESILAWLMTQPSTLENKIMRAQAGAVVDFLKAL